MKKFLADFKPILLIFFIWRIASIAISYLATIVIQNWGERFPYADTVLEPTGAPSWIWGFGNFDGVHYLKIAQDGYAAANTQVFFPLYPLLIRIFNIFPKNPAFDQRLFVDPSYFYIAFLLSNIFFLFALYFFYKLLRMDFDKKRSFWALILLLIFPTSFFFGAVYTESLFLLLVLTSIYSIRKKNFLIGGIFAGMASATRVLGLMLVPLIAYEIYFWLKGKEINLNQKLRALVGFLLASIGAIIYMVYLRVTTGNYFYFLTAQSAFGAQRSADHLILLPQVIFRYLKIFLSIPIFSLEFFNAVTEFLFAIIPFILLVAVWKKLRPSYRIFTLGVLITPTLTGTFSSMPRYVLMGFLLLPYIVNNKLFLKVIIFAFIFLATIFISLFTRGYWVA